MVAATEQRTLASKDLFFHWQMEENTGLQWCRTGHPGNTPGNIQDTSEHILGVHLHTPGCIFPFFWPEKHPWCILCTCAHPMTSLAQKWCHLVVGHTLTYTLSKFEVNQTDSSRDVSTFVSSPLFSQSDHYQTIQHLRHGLRTNSTATDYPVYPGHHQHYC